MQHLWRANGCVVDGDRRLSRVAAIATKASSPISCMDAAIIAQLFHNHLKVKQELLGNLRNYQHRNCAHPSIRYHTTTTTRVKAEQWGPILKTETPFMYVSTGWHSIGGGWFSWWGIEQIRNLLTHCCDRIKSNRFKLHLFFFTFAIGYLLTSISLAVSYSNATDRPS